MFTTNLSRFKRNQRRVLLDGGYRKERETRKGFLNILSKSFIGGPSHKRIKLEKQIERGLIIRDLDLIAKRWGPRKVIKKLVNRAI